MSTQPDPAVLGRIAEDPGNCGWNRRSIGLPDSSSGPATTGDPPKSPALASDALAGQARSPVLTKGEHWSWRTVGAGIASLGVPIGIGVLHPMLGEVIAVIEIAAMLTIMGTALFGSSAKSERAFRLLRWIGNRPEPPTPKAASSRRSP